MGNPLSKNQTFSLIAELKPNGELICNNEDVLQRVLEQEKMDQDIVLISVFEVENQQSSSDPYALRLIDCVQFFLEKRVNNGLRYADWESNSKHFPRSADRNVPSYLKGKNGILLQVKPYETYTTEFHNHQTGGEAIQKSTYLLSVWIGKPENLKSFGTKKLRDFLYFTSSIVLHASRGFSNEKLDSTSKLFWESSAVDAEVETLESICFVFFNWAYNFNFSSAEAPIGRIHGEEFDKWTRIYDVAEECRRISKHFREAIFYGICGEKPWSNFDNTNKIESVLAKAQPMLKYHFKGENLVKKHVNRLNSHYPALKNSKELEKLRQREENRRKAEIRNNFNFVVQKLVQNSTLTASELDQCYVAAVEQVRASSGTSACLKDVQLEVESEWQNIIFGLTELDNLLLDLEAQLGTMLLSPNVDLEQVNKLATEAELQVQQICTQYGISGNIQEARSGSFLKKISSVAEVLKIVQTKLKKPCMYLSDAAIDEIRTKAIEKLTKSGFGQDLLAVSAVDMVLDTFNTENDWQRQQAGLLAGETIQFAVAEYRKSMEIILKEGIYSSKSLKDFQNQFLEGVTTSCNSSNALKNEVWTAIRVEVEVQLKSLFPEILEKNYRTSKAVNDRRTTIYPLAFETYLSTRGPDLDYHQLEMKIKKSVHVEARQSAFNLFVKQTKDDQAWARKQWMDELFETRIRMKAPDFDQTAASSIPTTNAAAGSQLVETNFEANCSSLEPKSFSQRRSEQRTTTSALIFDKVPRRSTPSSSAEQVTPSQLERPNVVAPATTSNHQSDPAREELKSLIEKLTLNPDQQKILPRSVRKDVTQALDEAKQVIEQADASKSTLRQAVTKLESRQQIVDKYIHE